MTSSRSTRRRAAGSPARPRPGRHERPCVRSQMITVTGEALIDLVIDGDGSPRPRPGGGPFNTARTIGRLGLAPAFLGRLSRGGFGDQLRARLDQDGVTLAAPARSQAPPTPAGVARDRPGA